MTADSDVTARLVHAWEYAATELGIELVAPFRLGDHECVCLVKCFGRPNGTIVMVSGDEAVGEMREEATAAGYYVSLLDPTAYRVYDRGRFIETLDDWGWCGDPSHRPPWYSGHAWGVT